MVLVADTEEVVEVTGDVVVGMGVEEAEGDVAEAKGVGVVATGAGRETGGGAVWMARVPYTEAVAGSERVGARATKSPPGRIAGKGRADAGVGRLEGGRGEAGALDPAANPAPAAPVGRLVVMVVGRVPWPRKVMARICSKMLHSPTHVRPRTQTDPVRGIASRRTRDPPPRGARARRDSRPR